MDVRTLLVTIFTVSIVLAIVVHPSMLMISLLVIIMLGYINCRMTTPRTRENFEPVPNFTLQRASSSPRVNTCARNDLTTYTVAQESPEGRLFESRNQHLAGSKVHPRTLVAPVIVPPSYAQDYWKKNNFNAYPMQTNRPRQQDLYLSGYVSGPCPSTVKTCGQAIYPQIVKENYADMEYRPSPQSGGNEQSMVSGVYTDYGHTGGGIETSLADAQDTAQREVARKFAREQSIGLVDPSAVNGDFVVNAVNGGYRDPFRASCSVPNTNTDFVNPDFKNSCKWGCNPPLRPDPEPVHLDPVSRLGSCSTGMCNKDAANVPARQARSPIVFKENFEMGESPVLGSAWPYANGEVGADSPRYPYYDAVVNEDTDVGNDYVNKECTYNPGAISYGLPVNKCVGSAQLEPGYINYNKNQGTQIVQPGMYFQSDVLDPINSNIGISYSQQFQPQTSVAIAPGEVVYKDHDANQFVGETYVNNAITGEELQNIYDPRYTGYASNDRYYLDTMTGQPRFFYDDIDAVKRPSYIVRSNVDHLGQFDQTGAMKHGKLDFDYREVANNEFHESALDQRSDIQVRLAQKNYARTAQLRDMPLSNTGRLRGR